MADKRTKYDPDGIWPKDKNENVPFDRTKDEWRDDPRLSDQENTRRRSVLQDEWGRKNAVRDADDIGVKLTLRRKKNGTGTN